MKLSDARKLVVESWNKKAKGNQQSFEDCCTFAQTLALLSIADDLETVTTYTAQLLDQVELGRIALDGIENELEKRK